MWRGVLKPTVQRGCKKKIFGFDIETYDDNREFYCASVYYDEDNNWTFFDKQELIDFFKTKRFKNSYVVATNLSFDFFGLFHGSEEIMQFNTLFRGSDLLFAKSNIKNKQFSKTRYNKDGGSHGYPITFLDTYNYCRMSVERLGKTIGIEKLQKPSFLGFCPKTDEEKRIMVDYNMRDAEVSKKYMEFLFNSFYELGATPKETIAQTALSLFKNKYLKTKYFRHDINDLLEIFEGYYGGRTEAFKRGQFFEHNYYDFNSLYPSVMRGSFPDPNTHQVTHKNTKDYIMEYEGMSDVSIVCPSDMQYPLLPFRTKDKLLFPTGSFRGFYTHVELRKALSLGYEITKVHKTHYYKENCSPFRGYVEDLYAKRLEYRKDNNPMQQVVKLLLNSLYGKFGQKFMDKDNWMPFNHTLEELDKLDSFERIGNFIRLKKDCEPSAFCVPIWAAYVTAYGRIKLHDAIIHTDPVYCDTDSIVTRRVLETSDELGELKLEMGVKRGYVIRSKMYAMLDDKDGEYVKIKGIGKRLTFQEFIDLLKDPQTTYDKFTKFKEAMRRGFVPNEIREVTKNLSLEDDKRLWLQDLDFNELQVSLPVELIYGIRKDEIIIKSREAEELRRKAEIKTFTDSDLFDKASVGSDITPEEFLENEQFFARINE